jgi:hypothetical protein
LIGMKELHLEYKPDASQACARMEAYWEKAILDRPAVLLTAPKEVRVPLPEKQHATQAERWMDVEYIVELGAAKAANTYWAGDGLPLVWPNLGPEILTACFGAPLTFGEDTSWSTPILHDWSGIPDLKLDETNRYLQTILDMQKLSLAMGQGKWITGLTDIHPGADLAASFRDPQQLCVDLMDAPEQVHALLRQIFWAFFDFYELQRQQMLAAGQTVTSAWLPMYCTDGRYYIPSCDFSIMVSTEMFREFFLPELLAEIAWLDRTVYHLDGPGAVRHLDTLLDIGRLDAIQFVYGDGAKPASRWMHVFKRIQAGGKNLHITIEPWELDAFMTNLRPEGVMLQMEASSAAEADAVLKKIATWK